MRVEVLEVLPYENGAVLFLRDEDQNKICKLETDSSVGYAISLAMQGDRTPRPLTHDLFYNALLALSGKVTRVTIARRYKNVFFAALTIEKGEGDVPEGGVIELSARPGDAIAMALRFAAPIYVDTDVWQAWEDSTAFYGKTALRGEDLPGSPN